MEVRLEWRDGLLAGYGSAETRWVTCQIWECRNEMVTCQSSFTVTRWSTAKIWESLRIYWLKSCTVSWPLGRHAPLYHTSRPYVNHTCRDTT